MKVNRVLAVFSVVVATCALSTATAAATPSVYDQAALAPHDFDFDSISDPAVFSPDGNWTLAENGSTTYTEHFGTAGDVPTVWNTGGGLDTVGVFRPSTGTWYLHDVDGGRHRSIRYGTRGDIPVQAHYRSIWTATVLGVFRPSLGMWYLRGVGSYQYGRRGDVPVPGHYRTSARAGYADGIALFRPTTGTWYIRGIGAYRFGTRGDIPAPADYNGDGNTDIAVFRPSTGTWYVRGIGKYRYGTRGDIPVTGDYNGDGRSDVALFRPSSGRLYLKGQGSVAIGSALDTPIGAAPYHD